MGARAEVNFITIRGGKNFKDFGDDYDWVVSAYIKGSEAYLFALAGEFQMQAAREIKEELAKLGVVKANWERIKREKVFKRSGQ